MSYRVPDAEYAAIKSSWRRAPSSEPPPTIADCIEMCHRNGRAAAQHERDLRELYQALPAGDPRVVGDADNPPLREQIATAMSDQRHWRDYLSHYQERARREGPDAVVAVLGLSRAPAPPAPRMLQLVQPQRDPRLPREPGDDSDDDIPF